jgi:enterobacteria phage integrase
MTQIKLRYVKRYADRHNKVRYYFRRGSQKGALPGLPGSAEFMSAYQAFLGSEEVQPKTIPTSERSFGRLITVFYASRKYKDVKRSSRRTYGYALEPLAAAYGHEPAQMTHQQAEKLIADIGASKPALANLSRAVLRMAYNVAVKEGLVEYNPFIGIRAFKTGTHHTWTEGELRQFEQCWKIGTRQRLAYELLLCLDQRTGDTARMKRSDIENGELHVIQEKTGTALVLPVTQELVTAMRACPQNGFHLICQQNGRPLTTHGLASIMNRAIKKAGLPGRCVPHGLRKAAIRRMAEDGKSAKEIAAVSGHKTLREIERYTEAADQRLLARRALNKG